MGNKWMINCCTSLHAVLGIICAGLIKLLNSAALLDRSALKD